MLNREDLYKMYELDVSDIVKESLANIGNVFIDSELPQSQRINQYLEQVKNPYCFLSGETVVRIRFTKTDKTLSDALAQYFSRLSQK